jgi:hypothetical protein
LNLDGSCTHWGAISLFRPDWRQTPGEHSTFVVVLDMLAPEVWVPASAKTQTSGASMLDSDPPTFAIVASDALLAALQKASEATNLSCDERYEVAVARFLTARALWRAGRQ